MPAPSAPPTAPRKPLAGWRLFAVALGAIAVIARLLLFFIAHNAGHPAGTTAALPTWPLKAGDTFILVPGDPIIAKWAEAPDNDGYLVQLAQQNGHPVTDVHVCALEPDYMAGSGQPGGTLTLLSQDGTGDWRVHWHGGDTMPTADTFTTTPTPDASVPSTANCGRDAVFTMSQAQLHAWLNMQSGPVPDKPTGDDSPETPPMLPSK